MFQVSKSQLDAPAPVVAGFYDNVYKSIQMHMVITFIVLHTRLIIIMDDLSIGSINDMGPVTGKDTMVFELMRCLRERRREFVKEILKCSWKDLTAPLVKGGLGRDEVGIHFEVIDKLIRYSTFFHRTGSAAPFP